MLSLSASVDVNHSNSWVLLIVTKLVEGANKTGLEGRLFRIVRDLLFHPDSFTTPSLNNIEQVHISDFSVFDESNVVISDKVSLIIEVVTPSENSTVLLYHL